jgi:hypothetical protein
MSWESPLFWCVAAVTWVIALGPLPEEIGKAIGRWVEHKLGGS